MEEWADLLQLNVSAPISHLFLFFVHGPATQSLPGIAANSLL